MVWIINPIMKMLFEVFRLFFLMNKAMTRSCMDPWCQSFGLALSFIRINVNLTGGGGRLPTIPVIGRNQVSTTHNRMSEI